MKAWAASRLVADHSADSARLRHAWPWRPLRHGLVRLGAWAELAAGTGAVDEAGSAVLCLSPRRVRDVPGLRRRLALGLGAAGFGGLLLRAYAAPVFVLFLAAIVALCARAGLNGWRDRGVARVLRAAKPRRGWYLHNFVRHPDHKGAGGRLLALTLAEADERGRTIYLDTTVARLVDYYRGYGFMVVATAPTTYAGELVVVTRMVRLPSRRA